MVSASALFMFLLFVIIYLDYFYNRYNDCNDSNAPARAPVFALNLAPKYFLREPSPWQAKRSILKRQMYVILIKILSNLTKKKNVGIFEVFFSLLLVLHIDPQNKRRKICEHKYLFIEA